MIRYPFTAIVGQEQMKLALLLNMINPKIGGVLIMGEKGTAKSTVVRGLALLTEHTSVVELPISATEDKLVGSIDIEHALKTGETKFEPGILHHAHGNILYVDEVNLLEDHLVDILLDVSAMGVNYIEREGISFSHPSEFVLVGTMNPEEGDLRPQLLDRFGLSVRVRGEQDVENRMEILKRRLEYDRNPQAFMEQYRDEERALASRILHARELLPQVTFANDILALIAHISIELQVDGHRADITLLKTAMALSTFDGRYEVSPTDVFKASELVLPHRMRRLPFDSPDFTADDVRSLCEKIVSDLHPEV
ncbi:ATP-binding protein [Porphyromonas pogonae]|uniref:ATP-binding protein n=1 Tax=Porphyromonas pogonae TaxID=867595 RepID=UPI002E769067|nr:AAA family ATPase [Porphyromonas pogonae]